MAKVEEELKFIPNSTITIEQVLETLSKQGITVQEQGKEKSQEDTYYDTSEGTLEKTGRSFRIRRKTGSIEVTYKEPIESGTEYKQRQEYQIVVSSGDAQAIDLETAMRLLKEKYPKISLPDNMHEELTVVNKRNKTNLICPDGTVLEMAFDSLKGKKQQKMYSILPEIEFEVLSGDPQNLTTVYTAIVEEFKGRIRPNTLSKYARTKKEMEESELTVDEVATCVLFSQVLNSQEFDKLKHKGQILHRYDKPTEPNLDNFKNFEYFMETLKRIKRGDYKFAIPRAIADNAQIRDLLEGENYEVKDEITLEDMMCLLLSDMKYKVLSEVLVHFLNTNYYGLDDATTNRFSHSQQVMLASGLLARSVEVGANFEERLTSMMSALFHDIGHVPMSHTLEAVLNEMDGVFSHEINGKKTIDSICSETQEDMMKLLIAEFPEMRRETIEESLDRKATDLKAGIANHSRKGATKRIKGINNQAPRVNDKICYVASDIADLRRYALMIEKRKVDILDEKWVDDTILEICEGESGLFEEEKEKLEKRYISHLRAGDYGRAIVNVISSIQRSPHGDREHYNVNSRLWRFIEKMIKRIKDVREEMTVEQAKLEMSKSAMDYIMDKLQEEYTRSGGDIETAWENTLRAITRMGEMDLLNGLRDKYKMSLLQGLNAIKTANQNDVTPDQMNNVTARKIEECAYLSYLAKGMSEEQAREMAKKIGQETSRYSPEEILVYFRKYNITYVQQSGENRDSGAPDFISIIDQLHDMADVQLKFKPGPNVSLKGICADAKIELESGGTPSHITDEYYKAKITDNNSVRHDIRMKVRYTEGSQTKFLVVKIPIGKSVPERTKRQLVVECPIDYDMEAMLQEFHKKYKGKTLELLSDEPYESIDTHRMEFQGFYKGHQIEILQDTFSGREGLIMQEVELKCPTCPKTISKLRDKLKEKYASAFIATSKVKRIQAERARDR